MALMIYVFTIILGLMFGSFASVIIHRLHLGEKGILWGRSKCPKCERVLGVLDLIPVVSYVLSRAKCRFCKAPIALRYPLMELCMAALFGLTISVVGAENWSALGFYLLMSFVFVLLSFYDFLFKEVPDEISLPSFVTVVIYMLLTKQMGFLNLLIGVAVPVLFFSALYFGSRGRWLGGGDIRIGALMGALLGWPMVLVGLFLGYLVGSIYSVGGLIIGKFDRKTQIPFVPFLLIGTYMALFWGADLLAWYQF